MSFVGDLVDPETRDPLLAAAGCRPWEVLRREAERLEAVAEIGDYERSEIEALMQHNGGGELGSVT